MTGASSLMCVVDGPSVPCSQGNIQVCPNARVQVTCVNTEPSSSNLWRLPQNSCPTKNPPDAIPSEKHHAESRRVALICIESRISDWIIVASCYYALANICGAIQRVGSGSLQDQDITLRKISTVTFCFIYTFGWGGEWTPRLTQPVDSLVPRHMFSQQRMYYITAT